MRISRKIRFQLHLQKLLFVILILAIAGMLGWLSNKHAFTFDWTSNKRNTLSSSSIGLLETLDGPVNVHVYLKENQTVSTAVEEILRRYQRVKPDFNFRLINPDIDFDTAQQDEVERYGQVIIQHKDKKERITSLSEQAISNALLRLSRSSDLKVAFLKGHGERSPQSDDNTSYSKLANELTNKGFTIESHNLLLSPLPSDTAVLVIAAPAREILEGELDHIIAFIEDGGNLLWMMDPGELQGTEALAEMLGISFHPGIIVDNNANLRKTLRIQHPAMVPVLDYHQHAITEKLQYNTLFPISRGVEQLQQQQASSWSASIIAQSLPRSWSEAGGLAAEVAFEPENGDVEGPVTLILALERAIDGKEKADKASQRIIVAGDSDFLANSYIGAGANLSLGLGIFNWLAGDDDLIAVESKNAPDTKLELDDIEIMLIGAGFFIVLPLVLILAGAFIWMKRRKR